MADKTKYNGKSAADILATDDYQFIEVEVPEWQTELTLRSLTAEEAMDMNERFDSEKGGRRGSNLILVQMSVITHLSRQKEGDYLFTADQLGALKGKSLKAISRIADAALKLNGMDKAARAREEADAKND